MRERQVQLPHIDSDQDAFSIASCEVAKGCLDDEYLVNYALNACSPADFERTRSHTGVCELCRDALPHLLAIAPELEGSLVSLGAHILERYDVRSESDRASEDEV